MRNVRQHGTRPPLLILMLAAACTREPEALLCPDASEGELVITELRGPQSGTDTWGQWVELFNASGADIDLYGLRVTLVPADGSEPDVVLVRTEPVSIPLGEYAVLGREDDRNRPEHMDYGYEDDFDGDLPTSGKVELEGCGELLDTVTYRELPVLGSLALDGSAAPDALLNDDQTRWCPDATEPPLGGPQTELGVPGTPGEENRPCP